MTKPSKYSGTTMKGNARRLRAATRRKNRKAEAEQRQQDALATLKRLGVRRAHFDGSLHAAQKAVWRAEKETP